MELYLYRVLVFKNENSRIWVVDYFKTKEEALTYIKKWNDMGYQAKIEMVVHYE